VTAGLLAVYSVVILCLPLFNYLGYEFSGAVAFAVPLYVVVISSMLLRQRWSRQTNITMPVFDAAIKDLFIQNALLLLIPLLLALGAGLFVKNCSFGEGLLFYLLIPAVTALWSVALFVFCYVMVRRYVVAYCAVMVIIMSYPLYLGYFTPAIYSYNIIYGFFPGFTYDESMSLSLRLVLFRYLTILSAVFMLLFSSFVVSYRIPGHGLRDIMSLFKQFRFHRLGLIVLLVIAFHLVAGFIFRVPLGFESTSTSVQSSLGSSVTTEHFTIYYSAGSFTAEEIPYLTAMHEFRYEQVRAALQVSGGMRIDSYIYPSADEKRRWIGAGNTNIAKPWRDEIHLNYDSWEGTLKHELVHVAAGEFGIPVINAHYNMGLTEGLATAIDDDFGNRTISEYAAAMKKFQLVDDFRALIHPAGFAMQSSGISYVAMGSFCQFLIEKYGIDTFKKIYRGSSPEDVYGKSYDYLIGEWEKNIADIHVPDEWRAHIEFLFKRPSIFAKECARVIAKQNEYAARLLAENNPAEAMEAFGQSLQTSWNTAAYAGIIRSAYSAEQYDTVIERMRMQPGESTQRAGVTNLLLLYGDALWIRGDIQSAIAAYSNLLRLDLSDGYNEAATIRLSALSDTFLVDRLASTLIGKHDDVETIRALAELQTKNSLVELLIAKFQFRLKDYNSVIITLGSLTVPFSSTILESSKNRLMGEAYFELGEYDHASAHFKKMMDYTSNRSTVKGINDKLLKCEWFENDSRVKSKKE
jgi:tetratricopeptide (TPR) repeat protein